MVICNGILASLIWSVVSTELGTENWSVWQVVSIGHGIENGFCKLAYRHEIGGHGGRVVTLSPPTSAAGDRSLSWP